MLEGHHRALMLFGDENFIPYFQKPYERTTREERRAAALTERGRPCDVLLRKGYGDWVTVRVQLGLGVAGVTSVAEHVAGVREARPRLATALRELDALRGTSGSYDRVQALEVEFTPQLRYLWDRERGAFRASLDAARGSLANSELPQRGECGGRGPRLSGSSRPSHPSRGS